MALLDDKLVLSSYSQFTLVVTLNLLPRLHLKCIYTCHINCDLPLGAIKSWVKEVEDGEKVGIKMTRAYDRLALAESTPLYYTV